MKVEMDNFTVTEKDDKLSVTAKNGFTVRLSLPSAGLIGVHINGPTPGDTMEVWTTNNPKAIRKTNTVSIYPIPAKGK